MSIPFQFTARHFGGQIDTLHAPVQTLFNYASGVVARLPLPGPVFQALRLNAYGLLYRDNSGFFRLPFTQGNGLYLNGTLETHYADAMLSYWRGHEFFAPLGGPYYQSCGLTLRYARLPPTPSAGCCCCACCAIFASPTRRPSPCASSRFMISTSSYSISRSASTLISGRSGCSVT